MATVVKLSRQKKILFVCILFTAGLFLFEAGARIAYYIGDDYNPYYLVFGFVKDTNYHSNDQLGYSKFHPNTYRHQKLRGGTTNKIKINNVGFRSLRDFVIPKPRKTLRIVTLGASSTFGYSVKDTETYPYRLELLFQDLHPGIEIEVLNLGIPHARSNNILSLARHELPDLEPDIITLYAGLNNALLPSDPNDSGGLYRAKMWLHFHSVAYRVIHQTLKSLYFSIVRVTEMEVIELPGLSVPMMLNEHQVDQMSDRVVGEFASDVEGLIRLADSLGSSFFLVTQNYSLFKKKDSGLNDRWRSYGEEVELIEDLLRSERGILSAQASKLIHRDIMDTLREIAEENELILVDGISPIEETSENMVSHVHLAPQGSDALAVAIFDAIIDAKLIPAAEAER